MKCANHVSKHDNYMERYLPIRTQNLINDTLSSVLGGKSRRRLELYENEVTGLLFDALLNDDGRGNLIEQMRAMHAKAKCEIEAEDKLK